jgi:hypothetical protein
MPRWVRILLTILAAAIGAWAGLMVVGGGAAGIAWIFLFGDDPWPRWSEIVIPLVALAGAVSGAAALGRATWRATGNYRS